MDHVTAARALTPVPSPRVKRPDEGWLYYATHVPLLSPPRGAQPRARREIIRNPIQRARTWRMCPVCREYRLSGADWSGHLVELPGAWRFACDWCREAEVLRWRWHWPAVYGPAANPAACRRLRAYVQEAVDEAVTLGARACTACGKVSKLYGCPTHLGHAPPLELFLVAKPPLYCKSCYHSKVVRLQGEHALQLKDLEDNHVCCAPSHPL